MSTNAYWSLDLACWVRWDAAACCERRLVGDESAAPVALPGQRVAADALVTA